MERPHETEIAEAKARLRAEAKGRRSALSIEARQAAARALARHGLAFLDRSAPSVVSGFLAIGEEIDPALLLQGLAAAGSRICLPVMVAKGQPLAFRAWTPGAPLVTRMWGIREPGTEAPPVQPDVLLVPLLAFDRRGNRLGYGGGFYDRTLADLRRRRRIVAVGLAFATQEVDAVPHLDYDERLDWVLTSEGPIRCSNP